MTPSADVVVVGAGIIGASISFQLARRGASVITVDKAGGPGEGATGASSSICRCRYTHGELVDMARYGIEAFTRWEDFTGLAGPRSRFQAVGALWMTGDSPEGVAAEVEMLQGHDVAARSIGPPELKEMFPALSACVEPIAMETAGEHFCSDDGPFLFEPDAGFTDPVGANQDLIEAAERNGAEVRFRSAVSGLVKSGERVAGVALADGSRLHSGVVVNAAGPWSGRVNEMAGLDLPWTLTPTRIQTVYRSWPLALGPLPFLADGSTGIYLRPMASGEQIMVGSVIPEDEEEVVEDPDHFKRVPDADFTEAKLAALHHRIPGLEPRGQPSGIAGLYSINREDVHPLLGPSGVDGLWLAIGFSGHGFKLAPAVGAMMAAALTGETEHDDPQVSLDMFSVGRDPLDVRVKSVLA